jgi:gliding motility-associated-like protein
MKFNTTTTTLIFLLIISPDLAAQGENDNWIFGQNAHISFKKGYPEIQHSGVKMNTMEGSTSVSDPDGRLLFYSDGNTVWNKLHGPMPNGEGLLGHRSSTSSAVAVPYPGQPRMYFLFCVDQNLSGDNKGLSYNLINMDMDYGLGDIVIKNRILTRRTDEKIAVTKQCNGKDFWVVIHKAFTDSFMAYGITENGLNLVPVISTVPCPRGERPEIGYLKFSPSGKILVNAQTLAEQLDIYDFDKKTGRISLWASDPTQYHRSQIGDAQTYYGVAFSKHENFLYVSTHEGGEIFQYNLKLTSKAIFAKRYLVAKLDKQAGGLQLAMDNKIYASDGYDSHFMHCIAEPGNYGQGCNFRARVLEFPYDMYPNVGLPTLIETSLNYYNLGRDLVIQNPSGFTLDAKIINGKYNWSTGDTTRTIRISDTGGIYWVNVFDPSSCFFYTDTIRVLVYKKFLSDTPKLKDLSFCSNSMTSPVPLRSKYSGVYFLWMNDDPGISLPKSGRGDIPSFFIAPANVERQIKIKVYPVKQGYVGQEFWIEIHVKPVPGIDRSTIVNKEICAGKEFPGHRLVSLPSYAYIRWYNDNTATGLKDSGSSVIPAFRAGTAAREEKSVIRIYSILDGCVSEPSFMQITVNPIPKMKKLADVIICSGEAIPGLELKSDQPGTDFMARNPLNPSEFIEIDQTILAFIRIPKVNDFFRMPVSVFPSYKGCRGLSDSFTLTVKPSPEAQFAIRVPEADTNYFHTTVSLLNGSSGYSSYSWSYQGNIDSNNNSPDMYVKTNTAYPVSLVVVNRHGCSAAMNKEVFVEREPVVFIPNSFSPNSDSHNDGLRYQLFGIASHKFMVYNRWGGCVFISSPENPYWDGQYMESMQADGTFTWVMNAVDFKGKTLQFSGTVTLIR